MDITPEVRNSPDFVRGRAEAEADIAAGRLGQRVFGKLAVWWEEVAQLLRQRYQITMEAVGGCTARTGVTVCALGYNERMNEEIAARFGSDVVRETWRQVGLLRSHSRAAAREAERGAHPGATGEEGR